MSIRLQRVNEVIKEEISQLLLREFDFDKNLVTITEVNTSPNLKQSKIKISVLPQENAKAIYIQLKKKIFDLQQALNKKLNMRPVPKISFIIDKNEAKAQRIEELLQQIKSKDKA